MVKNCIMCPLGCEMTYEILPNKEIKVSGNNCIRGERFLKDELTCPMRSVSTLVRVKDKAVACKTSKPVPKSKIQAVLKEAGKLVLDKKPRYHAVLIKNIAATGADLIVVSK